MKNLENHEKKSLERIHDEGKKAMMILEKMEIKLKDDYQSYQILHEKQQFNQRNYVVRMKELSQLTKELCEEQKLLLIDKKKVRMQRYQLDLLLQHMNDVEPMLLVNKNDGSRNRMMNNHTDDMMRSTYPPSSPFPSSSSLSPIPSSSSYLPSSSYPPPPSSLYASSQPTTTMNPPAVISNHDDYTNEVKNSYGDQPDFVKAIKGQLFEPKSFRHIYNVF